MAESVDPHAGGAQQPSSSANTMPAAHPIQSQMGPNPLLAAGLGQLPHGTAVGNTWPHAQAWLPCNVSCPERFLTHFSMRCADTDPYSSNAAATAATTATAAAAAAASHTQ